jgi:ankyrin repeat protein
MRSALGAVLGLAVVVRVTSLEAASGPAPGTYWQEDACTDRRDWCVEWVHVGAREVEVRCRWRGERTRHPGDDGTRRVYVEDGRGHGFDPVRTSGAAAFGSRQRQQHSSGSYFFPRDAAGSRLTLRDDGARAAIGDIVLDDARLATARKGWLQDLLGTTTIELEDSWTNEPRTCGQALRSRRDSDGGFSLERHACDAAQSCVMVGPPRRVRLTPEEARAFFGVLAASPLLHKLPPPKPTSADGPRLSRITLTTAKGALVFEGLETQDRGPWVYRADGRTLLVPTDHPLRALRLLQALTYGPRPAADPDEPGLPLRMAAQRGDVAALERLVNQGAEIDERTPYDGETALTVALLRGRVEAVRLLLDKGADPALANRRRETPLELATRDGSGALLALFTERARAAMPTEEAQAYDALGGAVASGSEPLVRALLPHTPPRVRDRLLGVAIRHGQLEVLRLLIEPGMDLDRIPAVLPLHEAAQAGHVDVVELLLRSGADARVVAAADGRTALSFARVPSVARALLSAGADVNARARDGATPLIALTDHAPRPERSAYRQRRKPAPPDAMATARVLLDAGADLHARDGKGFTALQACLRRPGLTTDQVALAVLLLERGADPDAADPEGVAPVWRVLARHAAPAGLHGYEWKPLLAALVRAGARDRPNAQGVRPREHAATLRGSSELLRLLEGLRH